jgi:hypothetical protein
VKIPFHNKGAVKTFSNIQKQEESITCKPTLKEMPKEFFRLKENGNRWKLGLYKGNKEHKKCNYNEPTLQTTYYMWIYYTWF